MKPSWGMRAPATPTTYAGLDRSLSWATWDEAVHDRSGEPIPPRPLAIGLFVTPRRARRASRATRRPFGSAATALGSWGETRRSSGSRTEIEYTRCHGLPVRIIMSLGASLT